MHVRHEALFAWLMERFPETRLYGPYHHGGRSYYQWMARGTALVEDVLPLLEGRASRRTRRLRGGAVRGDVRALRATTSRASERAWSGTADAPDAGCEQALPDLDQRLRSLRASATG